MTVQENNHVVKQLKTCAESPVVSLNSI